MGSIFGIIKGNKLALPSFIRCRQRLSRLEQANTTNWLIAIGVATSSMSSILMYYMSYLAVRRREGLTIRNNSKHVFWFRFRGSLFCALCLYSRVPECPRDFRGRIDIENSNKLNA